MTNQEYLAGLTAEEFCDKLEEIKQKAKENIIEEKTVLMMWLELEHNFSREEKEREDKKSLEKYRERLGHEVKAYGQTFSATAINNRRARALAVGECALKALEEAQGLAKTHNLKPGTLEFNIGYDKVVDPDGVKGYEYVVTYRVVSYEKAHTKEWIDAEIKKTYDKMQAETEEMFPEH